MDVQFGELLVASKSMGRDFWGRVFEDLKRVLPWKNHSESRKVYYAGHIIGRLNLQCTPDPNSRFAAELTDGQLIKVNDYQGDTRILDLPRLLSFLSENRCSSDTLEGVQGIWESAKRTLDQALGFRDRATDNELLQCNMNLYRSDDHMDPHRDDVTVRDAGGHSPGSTFLQAAATCVLSSAADEREIGANGQLAVLKPKTEKTLYIDAEVAAALKGKEFRHDHPDYEYLPQRAAFRFVCLRGSTYARGLHWPEMNWAPQGSTNDSFSRMSLNFRYVDPVTWHKIVDACPDGEARVAAW